MCLSSHFCLYKQTYSCLYFSIQIVFIALIVAYAGITWSWRHNQIVPKALYIFYTPLYSYNEINAIFKATIFKKKNIHWINRHKFYNSQFIFKIHGKANYIYHTCRRILYRAIPFTCALCFMIVIEYVILIQKISA